MDKNTTVVAIIALVVIGILVLVGMFALVALSIYLREVIAFKGKAKIESENKTVEAEVAVGQEGKVAEQKSDTVETEVSVEQKEKDERAICQ